jgi:hypothetical protein
MTGIARNMLKNFGVPYLSYLESSGISKFIDFVETPVFRLLITPHNMSL